MGMVDESNIVGEITVSGRKFFLVDPGVPRYINNVLVRYFICPISQFNREINNQVHVIEEDENEICNPGSKDETISCDFKFKEDSPETT